MTLLGEKSCVRRRVDGSPILRRPRSVGLRVGIHLRRSRAASNSDSASSSRYCRRERRFLVIIGPCLPGNRCVRALRCNRRVRPVPHPSVAICGLQGAVPAPLRAQSSKRLPPHRKGAARYSSVTIEAARALPLSAVFAVPDVSNFSAVTAASAKYGLWSAMALPASTWSEAPVSRRLAYCTRRDRSWRRADRLCRDPNRRPGFDQLCYMCPRAHCAPLPTCALLRYGDRLPRSCAQGLLQERTLRPKIVIKALLCNQAEQPLSVNRCTCCLRSVRRIRHNRCVGCGR